jgi:hypothetical protein
MANKTPGYLRPASGRCYAPRTPLTPSTPNEACTMNPRALRMEIWSQIGHLGQKTCLGSYSFYTEWRGFIAPLAGRHQALAPHRGGCSR